MDWLSRVAESLGLGRCTLHLAVKILDYFMDGHDILVGYVFKSIKRVFPRLRDSIRCITFYRVNHSITCITE